MAHVVADRSSAVSKSDGIFYRPCLHPAGRPGSALSDSEDENPEALQPLRPTRPLGHYGLCEQGEPEALNLTTPPPSPREVERSVVVINQPAPLSSPRQAGADTLPHSSDSVRHAIWAIQHHHRVIKCEAENELWVLTNGHAHQLNMDRALFDIGAIRLLVCELLEY